MRLSFGRRWLGGVVAACIFAGAAHAQDAAVLRQGTFEVGPFGGISYGVNNIRGMGGANATYSVLPNILVYGEYSYFPTVEQSVFNNIQTKFTFKVPLQDINFGVHARFRIPKTPLVPYGVVGVGLLYSPSSAYNYQIFDKTNPSDPYDLTAMSGKTTSSTSFALDYGAGVRWYIRENFGMRGEFKGYVLTGGPLHNPPSPGGSAGGGGLGVDEIFRATVGFFFQF